MSTPLSKRRSIWSIAIGDKVHSTAARYYNCRGEVTAVLHGARCEVRLYNGTTAIICIPDLEFV